jgi:ABC-type microcin C transport system permease subunit YejB
VTNNIVDQIIPDSPPVQKNLYRVAAKQLYSLKYSDNKKGLAMYKSMTEDEFKTWWKNYWSNQGLDPDILEEIYRRISPLIQDLGDIRVRDKLRFVRSKLVMVK